MRLDLRPPIPQAEVTPRPVVAWLRRLVAEPLLQFLVIGLILCGLAYVQQQRHDALRIVVTPGRVAQIARKYALQFGASPDPATLEQLVKEDIHDEVLFRQARALKLDRDDEIVRRRLVQKEQFLLQASTAPPEPTPQALRAYAAAHAASYAEPARATFSHVFFAADGGNVAAAQARAEAVLAKTLDAQVRAPDAGDPFPDLYDFSAFDPQQTARLFGHTPFAAAVFDAPVGRWAGPFRSAYGWHLLRVSSRTSAHAPRLDEVAARVRADLLADAQDRGDQAAYERVARRYTVVRADRRSAP